MSPTQTAEPSLRWTLLGIAFFALLAGFITRFVTFYLCLALSVHDGWSGAATFVVIYAIVFFCPIHADERGSASLVGIAFGRGGAPWPRRTRIAIAAAFVLATAALVTAMVAMPTSANALRYGSGVVFGVVLWFGRATAGRARIRRLRSR